MRLLLCRFVISHIGLWLLLAPAFAQLKIEITKGVEGAQPLAIVPFGAITPPPEDMAAIISANLRRSGLFEILPPHAYTERPNSLDQVNFMTWQTLKVDYLVVGQVQATASGYRVRVELGDVLSGKTLLDLSFDIPAAQLRPLAHHISDLIYEKLTGERGAFDSRVAYITAADGQYTLFVADADGANPQAILRSRQPLLSPTWSPDGNRLAYVSFEDRQPKVIVQDVYSGARQVIAAYPGMNSAPSWSPDGGRLAFTLSKDGNPEIYVYSLSNQALTRVTNSSAIDTEPVWLNSDTLVFTSDRGGSPQLYRVSIGGGSPQRLTFEGNYNARATVSNDGRYLAMVHRREGRFHIAVMDMQSGGLRVLTDGGLDESPSFAPNGRMIIYSTTKGGREVLAAVSVDGRVQQSLVAKDQHVREPAWSPLKR